MEACISRLPHFFPLSATFNYRQTTRIYLSLEIFYDANERYLTLSPDFTIKYNYRIAKKTIPRRSFFFE